MNQYLNYEENEAFPTSLYYKLDSLCDDLQSVKDDFIVITINAESIRAKIDKFRELLELFNERAGLIISAIAIQESWLNDKADINLLKIPGYHDPIHQGWICGRKGGLMTYVHSKYQAPIKRRLTPGLV